MEVVAFYCPLIISEVLTPNFAEANQVSLVASLPGNNELPNQRRPYLSPPGVFI